jgi:mono/diheme cytochrome c family protein
VTRYMSRAAMAAALIVLAACGGGDTADEPAAEPGDVPTMSPTPTPAANVELPEGVTAEMVAQGQTLFNQQVCMSCHGMNGAGSPLGPALNDGEWLNADGTYESILEVIHTGVAAPKQYQAPMPPMGGAQLTEEQMRQLAAYVFSISRG